MRKQNLKRKAPPEHKRFCRCTPFCGKKLTRQARRLHYKNLQPSQRHKMQDSETATESDDNSSLESGRRSPTPIYGSDDNSSIKSGRRSSTPIYGSDDSEEPSIYQGDNQHQSMEYPEEELDESGSDYVEADYRPRSQDDMVSEEGQEELASDSESEFDEWKDFDEVNEATLSDEEKLQELEEILSAEEYSELWKSRMFLTSHCISFMFQ